MRKPSSSERRSAWMVVTGAIVALVLVCVFAYAYYGSHVDAITPAAQQSSPQKQ